MLQLVHDWIAYGKMHKSGFCFSVIGEEGGFCFSVIGEEGGFCFSVIGEEGGFCFSVIGEEGGFCFSVIGEYLNVVPKPAPTVAKGKLDN
ncbi:MAG: hypothetical protein RIB93_10830 [Coleofasciculus sp. D1-CHI-01]|uniref:hypothetical protein n=1 Tax=Coleofasciculus sp. D1-CHI-01 TaxID=3068482 RepID=UPI0032FFA7A8